MKKKFSKLLRSALLVFTAFLAVSPLSAVDFFWEEAELFTSRPGSFLVSAYSAEFSAIAWQEVTPNADPNVTGGSINIHLAVKEAKGEWEQRGIAAGPYAFSGTEPSIISLVIDNRGRIVIAAAAGGAQIEILISADRGRSFSKNSVNMGAENSVAPRIFVRADGGYLLFVTRSSGQSLSIYYSRSNDGVSWPSFQLFTTENNLLFNFLPTHAGIGRRDIVFFQSRISGAESSATFQLFFKTSDDGGATWAGARRFTSFNDPVVQTQAPPNSFDNQRPHLTKYGDNLFLVWERRYTNQQPQIYSAVINASGNLSGSVERVNTGEAYCNNPIGFIYENTPAVVWFDNRRGNNSVVLAQRGDFEWQNYQLSAASSESSFARPVVSQDGAYIFWQSAVRGSQRIYLLSPDRTTASPRITAVNFTPSRPSRAERARVSWNIPADTSRIFGFSWVWSQDANAVPPEEVMIYNTGNAQNLNLELSADKEGEWYFHVSARDYAGNWSPPARVMYYKKTAAPSEVVIIEPELDDNGFLRSNTFNMRWEPSSDPYTAGYTWNLQYLGANENAQVASPPSSIMGNQTSVNFENQENGIWAFSVAAVDQAGNIGQPSNIKFRTNKFIPFTNVSYVDSSQDEQGILTIRVIGRGFETGGRITSVVMSQDGRPDLAGSFNILSDREIGGIRFENLEEGLYSLRLEHSTRGWYTADSSISVAKTGTVKFGDYSHEWKPSWSIQPRGKIIFNPITALAVILIIFCALGSIAAIRGIGGVIMESAAIKQEALAIITGDFMPMEKKQKMVKIQRKGGGLRFKLAAFTTGLVLLVVIMISTPIYLRISQSQSETLMRGLYDRSKVLLEGLASSTRANMPRGNDGMLELGFLPAQSAALPEAHYVTITGYGSDSIYNDHVMATNDRDILSKIDTTEFRPGVSRITDSLTPRYEQFSVELNNQAKERAADLARSIQELTQEGMSLALRTDTAGRQRLNDIQVTLSTLEGRLTEVLSEISGTEIGSEPYFSTEGNIRSKEREYIFFKPVMFRQGSDSNFFRGLIRLEVSLDLIIDAIYREQIGLLYTIGIFALIALTIGVIGAFILSSLIVEPIKKLAHHIEIIRDTEDKTKLAGVEINITSKDEIAILGNTINDMTHGLVKAALAASDLSIGKEIQKKFIPLDLDNQGNKQTSGFKDTPNLHFFGYYEGAKGVSGDYFDYRDLDGRYYAIIKCDVAGKGIPAALIMIQVATMFLNYFKQWKPNAKGMHIEEVVYQINDFIETLAFKGRFAAFTLCLFDSATGTVRFCNAGDNIVHYYDASERKVKLVTFPQSPATGVLPNFMIESSGGYNVHTLTIDKGDILLLYTDGIEEAKRKFRSNDFKEIICTAGPVDTPHENHLCGQADEEMSPERVEAIINAVMAREVYTLHKFHNPEEDSGDLQFDFTACEGNVEDVIMAMVSAEKMFRCYKPPNTGEDSRVLVDKKVDEFLKKHFLQYRRYCSHTREYPENPAYMYYTHVKEDEQYDDLTILGIKRK
jgi:serine phosphatase RsbU (regulator of sigma subunit)